MSKAWLKFGVILRSCNLSDETELREPRSVAILDGWFSRCHTSAFDILNPDTSIPRWVFEERKKYAGIQIS